VGNACFWHITILVAHSRLVFSTFSSQSTGTTAYSESTQLSVYHLASFQKTTVTYTFYCKIYILTYET